LGLSEGLEQKDLSVGIQACAKAEMPLIQEIAEAIQGLEEKTEAGVEEAFQHLAQA